MNTFTFSAYEIESSLSSMWLVLQNDEETSMFV